MLRLKSPGKMRFMQVPEFEATFGGGEANVAVGLANLGLDTSYVSVIPKNAIGDACIRELRKYGVNTDLIVRRAIGSASTFWKKARTSALLSSSMTVPAPRLLRQSQEISTGTRPLTEHLGSTSAVSPLLSPPLLPSFPSKR